MLLRAADNVLGQAKEKSMLVSFKVLPQSHVESANWGQGWDPLEVNRKGGSW